MPPAHLVAKVGGKKVQHGKGRRIVSRHTADRMTAMFRDVVVEGTGTEAAIPGYTVAGKTGTANKAENGALRRQVRRVLRRSRARRASRGSRSS